MHAAFQRMLDDCQTAFYVQVDEDMLLYPHGVRTLYERMCEQPDHVAIYVEHLFDTQISRTIQGVKIFRHSVVKHYPFRDLEDFEIDQIRRFGQDGFVHVVNSVLEENSAESVLGLHGTNLTRLSAYLRYFAIQRQQRQGKAPGWHSLMPELAEKLQAAPTETNFFALAGAMAGMIVPIGTAPRAKDYRTYAKTPGFEATSRFYDQFGRYESKTGKAQ